MSLNFELCVAKIYTHTPIKKPILKTLATLVSGNAIRYHSKNVNCYEVKKKKKILGARMKLVSCISKVTSNVY